jgi:hypothetical protein
VPWRPTLASGRSVWRRSVPNEQLGCTIAAWLPAREADAFPSWATDAVAKPTIGAWPPPLGLDSKMSRSKTALGRCRQR